MFKQYFKQVIYQLKENKLISWISILGTAFSIAIVMVMVILFQLKNANYRPEVNRDRTLYVLFGESIRKGSGEVFSSNYSLSEEVVRECLYPLSRAEAVSAFLSNSESFSTPGSSEWHAGTIKFADPAWWKIFDFEFLNGKPFTEADFQSGIRQMVITDEMARRLWNTADVVGRTVHLRGIPYTICGVVRRCSQWASYAWADAYAPYTASGYPLGKGFEGSFRCLILAKDRGAFEGIRQEVNVLLERYNQKQPDNRLGLRGQPYTHFAQQCFTWDRGLPRVSENVARNLVLLAVLLLVPAVNLSGLSLSRMRRRTQEIGIRRSFGATRWQIVCQVLNENLLFTLMGGVLGVLLSYLSLFLMDDWLLGGDPYLSAGMVTSPVVFLAAFVFCLLLNLLSAGIPAWMVARKEITDALR